MATRPAETAAAPVRTTIRTDIDLNREGKQTGFLRLPHSVHRSAFGYIPIPIVVVKNGAGPTALIMSGNHGDEYEGQVATCNAVKWLEPESVRGRVIILPAANFPAAMAGARVSPIDEGNMNRVFPGDPGGTVTAQMAHYIENVLLPASDMVLDIHSGGSSLMYVPSVLVRRSLRPDLFDKGLEALKALGAPLAYVSLDSHGGYASISGAARRAGIINLGTELGGGGQLTPAALRIAERAIKNFLVYMGILPESYREVPEKPTRILEVGGFDYFVYASTDGVFEPLSELGDTVRKDQPAARIHFPDTPWREPEMLHFKRDGFLLCKRSMGRVMRGDCVFHLGTDSNL